MVYPERYWSSYTIVFQVATRVPSADVANNANNKASCKSCKIRCAAMLFRPRAKNEDVVQEQGKGAQNTPTTAIFSTRLPDCQ